MFTISNFLATICVLSIGYIVGMLVLMVIVTRPRVYKWMLKKSLENIDELTAWMTNELDRLNTKEG